MARKPQASRYIIERVLKKSWDYLDQNFENFSEENKIKIALELCKKSMPDLHGGHGGQMPNINITVVNNGHKLRSNRETKLRIPAVN